MGAAGDTIQQYAKSDGCIIANSPVEQLLYISTLFSLNGIENFTIK